MGSAIIFSAHGSKFLQHAVYCAEQARYNITGTDIIIHTTDTVHSGREGVFDRVIYQQNIWKKTFTYRIHGMLKALQYYNKLIYVDNDVIILDQKFTNILDVLETHDVAVAHAKHRHSPGDIAYSIIPECYPEFNCGVIGYTRNSKSMLENWLSIYNNDVYKHPAHHRREMHDQGAFREAVYNSGLKVCTLPEHYN